ncbi:Hypothetical predicted protein, partial [Paramuricea clavata]
NECSFVSLRDVERAMKVITWFHSNPELINWVIGDEDNDRDQDNESSDESGDDENNDDVEQPLSQIVRAVILGIGVCYYARLNEKEAYCDYICGYFDNSCLLSGGACRMQKEIISDRYQRTYFKNTLSDMRPVKISVLQGSILGPLLFILFINDLPSQLSHSESTMFADDTAVLTEGSSFHDLNVKLNLVAQDLSIWTQQNRMVTNTLKTKTMLIHSPQQLKNTSDRSLSVTLNGNILAQESSLTN